MTEKLRVAVLMGGKSSEREVSLSTGKMIASALDPERYEVRAIDTQDVLSLAAPADRALPAGGADDARQEMTAAPETGLSRRNAGESNSKPDVVFIALHGKGGEDGTVQGLLEFLGIPYTGSGVLASALAMDKARTKQLFAAQEIPVIPGTLIVRGHGLSDEELHRSITEQLGSGPLFVKPNAEGSTFGCSLVSEREQLPAAIENALRYDPQALVEQYVRGREITVGVLDDEAGNPTALPIIEIVPKSAYYDYESKYADGGSEHLIPAPIGEPLTMRAQEIAVQCHRLLGCYGMSRTDMIVAGESLFVLEVNTIPGMTPTSLLPQAAAAAGIPFPQLLDRLVQSARKRRA